MRYDRSQHQARATDDYVFHQLLPYLGNKRKLLPLIGEAIAATDTHAAQATFADLFAGSGVVARFARQLGFRVLANDWEPYALAVNTAAIACEQAPAFHALGGYERAIATLNSLPPRAGWVSRHLCPADDDRPDLARERLFFTRSNGERIDAVRAEIAAWRAGGAIDALEQACLLAPLLYEASYVSNTSGVWKGFHAGFGGSNGTALHRIRKPLELRPAQFLATGRQCEVFAADATALAAQLAATHGRIDVAYLDPPYNQHPYGSNYHVLNTLVLWDAPPLSPLITGRGDKSAIRTDWRRSAYNGRGTATAEFARLVAALDARWLLVSYSTDGTIPLAELVAILAERGALRVFAQPYKRYRVSPTRPSPRPHNVEFVLTCEVGARRRAGGEAAVLAELAAASLQLSTNLDDAVSYRSSTGPG